MFRPAEDADGWPWKRAGGLLLIALALRVALCLWLPADEAFLANLPDQLEYLDLGRSLLAGEGLVLVDTRYAVEQTLLAYRMPGYPLLVAVCGGNVLVVRLVQALIDTSTVLAALVLARRWLPNGPALAAALLVALNPFLIYFSALLLTETVFTALLAWGLVGLTHPLRARRWWLGMLALLLGIYFRPSGAGLAVVLGIASVFLPGRSPFSVHSRWPMPVGLSSVLLVVLALAPWAIRNRLALGEWVWLTTNDGITLYDGWQIDNTTGGSDQRFVQRMPQLSLMNEVERSAYLKERALEAIRAQPDRSALLAVKKVGRTWSPVPLSQGDRPMYLLMGVLYAVPLFAFTLAGLWRARLPRSVKGMLILPAVYLTLVHMLSVGSLRYRLPAEVPMAILAAAGLWVIGTRIYGARQGVEEGSEPAATTPTDTADTPETA